MLVDDQSMLRTGLRTLLQRDDDLQMIGETSEGWQAVELAAQLLPDVVVMDLALPGLTGLDTTREIHQRRLRCAHRPG